MTVSKGLQSSVVALPGVGHMPAKGEDERDAARVLLCGTRPVAAGQVFIDVS
jgi:hypothetical protein